MSSSGEDTRCLVMLGMKGVDTRSCSSGSLSQCRTGKLVCHHVYDDLASRPQI